MKNIQGNLYFQFMKFAVKSILQTIKEKFRTNQKISNIIRHRIILIVHRKVINKAQNKMN